MAFLSIDQNKMRDQIVVEGKRFALRQVSKYESFSYSLKRSVR